MTPTDPNNRAGSTLDRIGMVIAILISIGGQFINRSDQVEARLKSEIKDVEERAKDRAANNHDEISKLDATLQREMRLVNAETAAKLESLDLRLQHEITVQTAAVSQRIEEARQDREQREVRVRQLEKEIAGLLAKQTTKGP